jgi:hypothetical protein
VGRRRNSWAREVAERIAATGYLLGLASWMWLDTIRTGERPPQFWPVLCNLWHP